MTGTRREIPTPRLALADVSVSSRWALGLGFPSCGPAAVSQRLPPPGEDLKVERGLLCLLRPQSPADLSPWRLGNGFRVPSGEAVAPRNREKRHEPGPHRHEAAARQDGERF